jgi:predicted amidohydrolase
MRQPTEDLRVAIVQGDTRWHDPAGNRALYGELVARVGRPVDLVVLPETFTSGFTNETVGNAEGPDGETMRWLAELAGATGAVVTGSVVVRDGERFFNRLVWMRPDGSHAHYDKRHLFRYAGEHRRYTPGATRVVLEVRGWRVLPQICYDLRFPVFARNRFDAEAGFDYDLALYVANWPSPRHSAWQTLLRARAIENLSFAIGVNRVGTDGNALTYLGGSVVLDPLGAPLVELGSRPEVAATTLCAAELAAHRERFPFHLDADAFELR